MKDKSSLCHVRFVNRMQNYSIRSAKGEFPSKSHKNRTTGSFVLKKFMQCDQDGFSLSSILTGDDVEV